MRQLRVPRPPDGAGAAGCRQHGACQLADRPIPEAVGVTAGNVRGQANPAARLRELLAGSSRQRHACRRDTAVLPQK
jgi:hypothetical protein